MLITKKSMLTGKQNQREIDCTDEQIEKWKGGQLIQEVMPNLTPSDREFLISGTTDEEWDAHFEE